MSAKESDVKVLSSGSVRSKGTLSGKCQRVEISSEAPAEPEVRTTHRKVSASELLEFIDETPMASTSQKIKKVNLSKYIDDNIRNFDPLAKRKERTSTCSSGENTTHSTGSNNSKGEKITESSLSAAVKDKESASSKNKVDSSPAKPAAAAVPTALATNVETPSKRSKSRATASKFSVDAVDSPQSSAAPVPPVSALASAMARSSTLLARSSKKITVPAPTSSEAPVPIVTRVRPEVAAAPRASKAFSVEAVAPTPAVDLNTTLDNNHTATNTHAPTLAFKTTAEEPASAAVAPVPAAQSNADALEVSRQKRVSFIAPAVQVSARESAATPAGASEQVAITPKYASSHSGSSSSRKATPSGEESASEGRARTHHSAAPAPVAAPTTAAPSSKQGPGTTSAGILSDSSRFIELNGRQYIRLNVLGKGGSSCVYRIIGADDGQIYAYKRVEVRDSEDVDAVFDSYANEIALLRRLSSAHGAPEAEQGSDAVVPHTAPAASSSSSSQSRIIELIDYEVRRDQRFIAMVLEAGDIDLAKVLTQRNTRPVSNSGVHGGSAVEGPPKALLDPFFARMAWREMLEAVDHIHQHRIVHGDLKPANFVFVKGHLKLIDFGIAKSFNSDTTNIYRESQIGTINYMAPEAIAPMSQEETEAHPHGSHHHSTNDNERLKMRLGRASDIWSLGCILYQMVYGRPPFAALNTIQKLSTIPNPKHVIRYADCGDADAVDSMKACLKHDARLRSKIKGPGGLLEMAYLQVPHNSVVVAAPASGASTAVASQQNVAIGKEQVTCIVGAVLDSLHATAQDSAEKAQASGRAAGTRNTRSGRGNAEAEAALKLAQGIAQWIDGVDQDSVEEDVMQVVKEQNWPVLAPVAFAVPAPAAANNVSAMDTETLPLPDVPPLPTATATARTSNKDHSPGSPHRVKRKAEDTPGSITRSATKPKRSAEPACVQKSAYKNFDHRIEQKSHSSHHAPSTAPKSSLMSPRAPAARPTFLHGLGAKIPVINLHAAVTATPSRVASSSTGAARRSPLKAMPLSLQQQILNSAVLRHQDNINSGTDAPAMDRAAKWMKPAPQPEENNMKSALEIRLSAMRVFLSTDQDNDNVTNTTDITGFF